MSGSVAWGQLVHLARTLSVTRHTVVYALHGFEGPQTVVMTAPPQSDANKEQEEESASSHNASKHTFGQPVGHPSFL